MQMVAPAAVQLAQQVHHRLAVLGVEVAGGLVGQQDRRLPADGTGDGDALLLTAGELRGQVLGAVGHADALERGVDALAPLVRLHAAVDERQLDVLEHREVADQVEALEDEADLAVADPGPLRHRQLGHFLAVQPVLAVGRRVEQAEDRQQRGLAAARRPGDGDVLALLDLHVDAREGVGLHLVGQEHLLDPVEPNEGLSRLGHRDSFNAGPGLGPGTRASGGVTPRPACPDRYRSRTRSNASQADMSDSTS